MKISNIELKLSSVNFYIVQLTHNRPGTAHLLAACYDKVLILQAHIRVAHTYSYELLHCQALKVTCSWFYYRDTLETLFDSLVAKRGFTHAFLFGPFCRSDVRSGLGWWISWAGHCVALPIRCPPFTL